jgi:hypothetical protein
MSIKLKDTIYDLVNNADKIDGIDSTSLFRKLGTNVDINTFADNSNKNGIIYINTTTPANINAPFSYGTILSFNSDAGSWMLGNSSSGVLKFRSRWWSGNGGTWGDWKDIAFKTDIPTIPTALKNPQALTIQNNGTTVGTYDGSAAKTFNITHPTIPTSLKCPTSLTIQFNGTSQGAWDGSTAKTINITPAAIGAAEASHNHSNHLSLAAYNLASGCLVKTDIPTASNTMITFRIEGNSYGSKTILTTGHFYNYTDNNQILNADATNHGYSFGDISVFCYSNNVYLWFKQQSNYQSFIVYVYSSNYGTSGLNRAVSISNSAIPSSGVTRKVVITPKTSLDSSNWSSYCAPASHTHSQYLTSFPNYAGSSSQGGAATSAAKLTTVSKTAWGQTYWTSGGVPTSISGAMSSVSSITFNNGNNSIIFNPKGEAALHAGDSWTILGYGTAGSGKDTYIDGNNIKFRYGTSWTEGMFLTNSGRFGLGINPTAYKADIRATENSDYDIHYYNQTTKSSLFIGKYFWYGTSNTSGEMFSISSGTNADGSGGSRFIRILADGKVGINTTPSYNLHVVGSTYSSSHIGTGGNLYVSQTAGTGAGISLYSNQSFVQSYGIWCGLGSTWGTVGDCTTGDWHMYFGMDGANDRGWLFRHVSNGVVASVASDGNFTTKAWYRTKGSGGWYSIDYGGGWYMNDSSWIRSFNYKPLYININENNTYGIGGHRLAAAFYGSAHVSILLSNTACGWGICSNGNKNLYFGYRNNTSLTSSTGDTYPMYVTPSGHIYATHLEGHSNSSTYLYASDSPYRWNDSAPYYMRMRYNVNSDGRWYLSVYPETPKSVSVDWAYGSDSVDGYHISVGSSAGSDSSTIYFIV